MYLWYNLMMSYDIRNKIRESVREWLEYKIKSTRGTTITVSTKKFYDWLGDRSSLPPVNRVLFWESVEELARELGLIPIFIRGKRKRVVFLIESRYRYFPTKL